MSTGTHRRVRAWYGIPWAAASVVLPCVALAAVSVIERSFQVRLPQVGEWAGVAILLLPGLLCLIPFAGRRTIALLPFYVFGMYYVLFAFGTYFAGWVYGDWP
jgi:hypothetical protein